jgi:hypothetical protein
MISHPTQPTVHLTDKILFQMTANIMNEKQPLSFPAFGPLVTFYYLKMVQFLGL